MFQLEGSGMTRYIKELKPEQFGEIASMIALYRPGPMDHIGSYIDAKHGRAPVQYLHEDLRDILEESYGIIVFQEQVLLITQKIAGYTLGEADSVRRAMGKKIPAVMAQEREKFITGALAQGYEQELAERVFSLIEPFAGYAFNKAHAVCYALISYWTAFRANYRLSTGVPVNAFSENRTRPRPLSRSRDSRFRCSRPTYSGANLTMPSRRERTASRASGPVSRRSRTSARVLSKSTWSRERRWTVRSRASSSSAGQWMPAG